MEWQAVQERARLEVQRVVDVVLGPGELRRVGGERVGEDRAGVDVGHVGTDRREDQERDGACRKRGGVVRDL